MANIFANVLSFLTGIINNNTSSFTLLATWDETECPKEML